MQALDGNAIAGALYDVFGREMTTATGVCGSCGAASLVAEVRVFARAPGAVARCPKCGNVVFVLCQVRETTRIDMDNFALREHDPPDSPGAARRP